ncbi:toll/interleukin-1 receptor domain-containing protein [Geodermatophilus poikilotrophus]|uniref:TIR domain-containing protein n=1 Tax=Geodermatophilus poikilotrophus TaxID=1333667 RepID=A0A1I0IPV5_9ACTN|nr:toll/interleukin-1 receptor domain-containing protein [Geodermatophilus poikilotrophus]SET99122.1 TIR domain-containing protein [Geodermatophilus poikilotrophus]
MKAFISWSGQRSRAAAEELHEWLQPVMPTTIEPWMSDTDLDKGSRWAVGLGEGLEEMSAGISVLTPENLRSPWLNFEAGAIGKAFGEGRVMTFLIGLSPTDVPQPLAQFQATSRTREDVTKMITDLNKLTETPMKDYILAKQIEAWWLQLDRQLGQIEKNAPA